MTAWPVDYASDTYLVVNPDGTIAFNFSGKIQAQGVKLDSAAGVPFSAVEWLLGGVDETKLVSEIFATTPGIGGATSTQGEWRATDQGNALIFARLILDATYDGSHTRLWTQMQGLPGPGNAVAKTILDSLGATDFVTLIADTVLGASAANIDFQSIPTVNKHLCIVFEGRHDVANVADFLAIRFNNDGAANYDVQRLDVFNPAGITQTEVVAQTSAVTGEVVGASAAANKAGHVVIFVPNYAGTTFHHGCFGLSSSQRGTAAAGNNFGLRLFAGGWRSAAAINRVTLLSLSGNLIAGSRATVYGLG